MLLLQGKNPAFHVDEASKDWNVEQNPFDPHAEEDLL